jgi:hypothetical protein
MPAARRAKSEPTEVWSQLQFRFTWPEQASYELIRTVVHFGRSPAERAQQTGTPAARSTGRSGGSRRLGWQGWPRRLQALHRALCRRSSDRRFDLLAAAGEAAMQDSPPPSLLSARQGD